MTTFYRLFACAIALLVLGTTTGRAQTPSSPPAGMTQQQFDSLVDAIAKSVAEKLKADTAASAKGKNAPAAAAAPASPAGKKRGEFALFVERAGKVLRSYPELGRQIGAIVGGTGPEGGGLGAGELLLLLAALAAGATLAEMAVRWAARGLRVRLSTGAKPELGMRSLVNLTGILLLDAVGLAATWLVCNGGAALFEGASPQDRFAVAVLTGIFNWRLIMLGFRFVLQPDTDAARLCSVETDTAQAMYRRLSGVLLLIVVGRVLGLMLVTADMPYEAVAAYQVAGAALYLAAFLWFVTRSAGAARQWLQGLATLAPVAGFVARHWTGMTVTFFVALGAAQIYSSISGRIQVGTAMLLTLVMVFGVLYFETLMQAVVRRLDSQLSGYTPASHTPTLPDVVARCIRVAVLIGATVVIVRNWVVEVLGLAAPDRWNEITYSSRTAALTLFAAFVAWELFKYATQPYMARPAAGPGSADDGGTAAPASRISTMMPLLRMTAAILIVFIAVTIALEDFGVNVMPLIAGASIFGIAISFGSQSLVRDIVSGIFFLTDDAFRVGEYIDCGRAKGTVEGFTLRSIKLRHQNGQVHTIPFGQLGQITNFSRDWITVKFNLRFARDTDIEKLRKTSKKIGQEMMEVPEIAAEILAPFKMQGVADIVDNALLVRFKFTARPGNPAMIQREAMKRLFNTLPGLGIEFAKEGPAVVLQTTSATAPGQEPNRVPAAAS